MLALAPIVLPLAFADSALAARPTREVIVDVDATATNTTLCSFPIVLVSNGSFKIDTFYDDAGNPVKSILTNYKVRYIQTATANGRTLTANFPLVTITSFPSGSQANVGLYVNYHAPGTGVLLLDAGRIVYDANGDPVFEAGNHERVDGDTAAFCAYFQ